MDNPISTFIPKFSRVESPYIEPGLLVVFRLAVILQIAVLFVRSGLDATVAHAINWRSFSLISLGGLVFLLLYLSWPTLISRLKRGYLPLALLIAVVVPILERTLSTYARFQATADSLLGRDLFGLSSRIYVMLLIPVVLMAWQYSFRWVLMFSGAIVLFSQGLAFAFFGRQLFQQSDLTELSLQGAITFLVVGYIMTRIIHVQREQRQALIKANIQLVDQAKTTEQLVVSRERNRMARDLHDTLAHTLSAMSIQLEAVDSAWDSTPEQARVLLVKALGTARSGLAETRRALQALRAAPLDDLGLALAVRTLAESMAARAGAKLVIEITNDFTLAPEVEQTVYRIAQEALTNIAKHAKAQTVQLTLGQRDDTVRLIVADDGIGFDTGQPTQAAQYGLLGMQERAQLIGGQLQVESRPRHGTSVRLTLANREQRLQRAAPGGEGFETGQPAQVVQFR